LQISDRVVPGKTKNPLSWLEELEIDVICLGYDQRGPFVEKLDSYIQEKQLSIDIVRI